MTYTANANRVCAAETYFRRAQNLPWFLPRIAIPGRDETASPEPVNAGRGEPGEDRVPGSRTAKLTFPAKPGLA
jgi:hypothetical protein